MTTSKNALRKTALPLLAVAAAGLMAACTTVGDPVSTSGSGATETSTEAGTGTGATSAPAPAANGLPSGVTPDMAQGLCDDLASQTQAMRTYTVTVGKVTLNGTVGTWAMKHNLNLVDLAQHREKVDQILETQCPDVRAEVIQALQLPDVASGLVGT